MDQVNNNPKKIKILTDVAIPQNPVWLSDTVFVGDLFGHFSKLLLRSDRNPWEQLRGLLEAFVFVRNFSRYDVVIHSPGKVAQFVAFVRAVFRIRSPRQIILELMLDEPQRSMKWQLKKYLQRLIFSSVDAIFVSSTQEVTTYSKRLNIPEDRFHFLPFHTDIISPAIVDSHDDYILSAGKTGRDYETLIKAVWDLDINVVIISDAYSAQGLSIPKNIKLLVNVSYDEYLEWMKRCWFVVVPLQNVVKSTGQVVFLEAMGLGKPVIVTETVGSTDYIVSGTNGVLVPSEDPVALKAAIENLIADKDLYYRLAEAGLETVRKRHTFDAYVGTILQAAEELGSLERVKELKTMI